MPQPVSSKLYSLPACLAGRCEERAYIRWLRRKAQAHVVRDRKRYGPESCIGEMYRRLIHQAVQNGGDRDYYTGQPLDWGLISTYDNEQSKAGRDVYLRTFANLPTVDHVVAEDGKVKFVICSWRVNDCKTHLSEDEFLSICEQVLAHRRGSDGGNQ
jgi:hypothetical protein